MDVCSYIDKFKRQGFVDMGATLLSSEEINGLSELVKNKFDTISQFHHNYQNTGMKCILNLLEEIPSIGGPVNNIVSNPIVREFLEEMLGKNYKIWDISARRACVGDPGLFLHQDGVGQINFFLSLDDNLKGEGASILLPSSHLVYESMKKWKVEMPPALLNFFPFMFTRLSGLKGEASFFSNRTWHGRSKNSSSYDHDVLSIGFFPAGYHYGDGVSAELASPYVGTELGSLLGKTSDVRGTILSNCECRESGDVKYFEGKSFLLNIENFEFLSKFVKPPKLIFSLITIRFLMFFVEIARSLRKFLGK